MSASTARNESQHPEPLILGLLTTYTISVFIRSSRQTLSLIHKRKKNLLDTNGKALQVQSRDSLRLTSWTGAMLRQWPDRASRAFHRSHKQNSPVAGEIMSIYTTL